MSKINYRFGMLVTVVLIAAFSRLLPHPGNFTPIVPLALFGGAYFNSKRDAILVVLGGMLLSDLILGWHSLLPLVYLLLAGFVLLGGSLRENKKFSPVLFATVSGAVLYFAITNLGVWLVGGLYPLTLAGLSACYVAAIPFFQNMLVGDLFYSALLFGSFSLIENYLPLADAKAEA